MISRQVALICALVLFVSMADASEIDNQTPSAWEKGSIPEKGYRFFTGIGKDIKSFLISNKIMGLRKIIDDKNVSKNIATDK